MTIIYCNKSYVDVAYPLALPICMWVCVYLRYYTALTFLLNKSNNNNNNKSPYSYPLAYLNCQHHSFCTLGPSLSKMGITWILALRSHNSLADNHRVTKWLEDWEHIQRGDARPRHLPGKTELDLWDVIILLRLVCNLKLVNCCFLEFSTSFFQTMVDCG